MSTRRLWAVVVIPAVALNWRMESRVACEQHRSPTIVALRPGLTLWLNQPLFVAIPPTVEASHWWAVCFTYNYLKGHLNLGSSFNRLHVISKSVSESLPDLWGTGSSHNSSCQVGAAQSGESTGGAPWVWGTLVPSTGMKHCGKILLVMLGVNIHRTCHWIVVSWPWCTRMQ